MIRAAVLCALSMCVFGCAAAPHPASVQPAPLSLTATNGRRYLPLNPQGHPASVLVFVLQDCPICNAYASRIERLASRSAPRGVQFYLVHVDPDLSNADADAHAREYGYGFPVLVDREHKLVKRLGVSAGPTAFVLDGKAECQSRGRI